MYAVEVAGVCVLSRVTQPKARVFYFFGSSFFSKLF
jgi:hypothetical protein